MGSERPLLMALHEWVQNTTEICVFSNCGISKLKTAPQLKHCNKRMHTATQGTFFWPVKCSDTKALSVFVNGLCPPCVHMEKNWAELSKMCRNDTKDCFLVSTRAKSGFANFCESWWHDHSCCVRWESKKQNKTWKDTWWIFGEY